MRIAKRNTHRGEKDQRLVNVGYNFGMKVTLQARETGGGTVRAADSATNAGLQRMEIPAGPGGKYRWAQLDDYMGLPRGTFPWRAPLRLELRARVSAADLPGTWGFGFWNDPFSMSFAIGGTARRLPALPNAVWFFYAGQPNYLAFHDHHPAQGLLAATFASANIPSLLLAPGALALPLMALPPAARLIRKAAGLFVKDDAALVPGDPTVWRTYRIDWRDREAQFFVDGVQVFATPVEPRPPLGLVIWIDNQYAAFPPNGRLRMGTSPNPEPAWLEIDELEVN